MMDVSGKTERCTLREQRKGLTCSALGLGDVINGAVDYAGGVFLTWLLGLIKIERI